MNLYQKIVEVRKSITGFSKDTPSYKYKYVSGSQVLGKIKSKMDELNLILIPSTINNKYELFNYTTDKGIEKTDFIVFGDMTYTWVDGDSPEEELVIPWNYYGQQEDISKAFGSALTYSERYFLLKFLGLPTDEDDADAKEEQPDKKNRKVTNNVTKDARDTFDKHHGDGPDSPEQEKYPVNVPIPGGISEKQVNRLYAIAKSKGYESATVDKEVKKQLDKPVAELDKAEYNMVVKGYENIAKG